MPKLVPMQRYRVELPRYKFPKPLTYMGLAAGDYRCMVCEREGGTRAGWSNRHSFVEGNPDNPTNQVIIGTECIKKCTIKPETAEAKMQRTMAELFEAAKVGTDCRPWTGNSMARNRTCRYGTLRSFYAGGVETPYNFKNAYNDGTEERGGPFASASESEKAAVKSYQKWFSGVANAQDLRGNW